VRAGIELDESVEGEESEGEDAEGEGAGGDGRDAGDAEGEELDGGPDGEGYGGVEVAFEVPVAEEVMADGGVAVPAFVGVLGPVGPGGVVGEVGVEMEEVQGEEDGCRGEQEDAHDGCEAEARGFRIGMCEFRLYRQRSGISEMGWEAR